MPKYDSAYDYQHRHRDGLQGPPNWVLKTKGRQTDSVPVDRQGHPQPAPVSKHHAALARANAPERELESYNKIKSVMTSIDLNPKRRTVRETELPPIRDCVATPNGSRVFNRPWDLPSTRYTAQSTSTEALSPRFRRTGPSEAATTGEWLRQTGQVGKLGFGYTSSTGEQYHPLMSHSVSLPGGTTQPGRQGASERMAMLKAWGGSWERSSKHEACSPLDTRSFRHAQQARHAPLRRPAPVPATPSSINSQTTGGYGQSYRRVFYS
ncbi:unnamed protein product [Pedinophyceae sp. YPF-701]|nr:unnamed protein product [Pedinophyceae sp. YPF-701]